MLKGEMPIGVFDSGMGGLSVLKEAVKDLPYEDFIYFGDSKNAPYGTRNLEEVKKLTLCAVDKLYNAGVKAIVVACNTATSAAIDDIREKYKDMIIVGMEPALKPAVLLGRKGSIVIMATPMTLQEKKFMSLMSEYSSSAEIFKMPCAGLVEYIEAGVTEGKEIDTYLKVKFQEAKLQEISSIVLGCTHYPFIKDELKKVVGQDIPIIDGSTGTVKNLRRLLSEQNLLKKDEKKGHVRLINSMDNEKIINISKKLLGIHESLYV